VNNTCFNNHHRHSISIILHKLFSLKVVLLSTFSITLHNHVASPHYGRAPGARQTPVYARQALYRPFFIAAHGKARTAAICTAKGLCRALFIARTVNILAVRQS
jgi:hypothetical protein